MTAFAEKDFGSKNDLTLLETIVLHCEPNIEATTKRATRAID